jgi:hypothetical protein
MVNVAVSSETRTREVAHVTIVEDDGILRLSPDELEIHPSTRVRFWNGASATWSVREESFAARLPVTSANASLIAVDPGRYVVSVVVRGSDYAWGEASMPLLIDFESPAGLVAVGTFSGRVSAPPFPDAQRVSEHPFTATASVRLLHLEAAVSASVTPARIQIDLLHAGEVVSTEVASTDASWNARDLPAGDYRLRITALEGVRVAYEVSGAMQYLITIPP